LLDFAFEASKSVIYRLALLYADFRQTGNTPKLVQMDSSSYP